MIWQRFSNLSYAERNQLLRRGAYLVLTLGFLIMVAQALFGQSGILVNRRVRVEYDKLLQEQEALKAENARLKQEILDLRLNPRTIEAIGRREYGFARPGEVIFYFPDNTEAAIQQFSVDGKTD